jgi:hypothetical protein
MARTAASSIVSDAEADQLAESYGVVLENVQKGAVSEQLKNKNYSGDATSGSVEVSRFANAEVKAQGTARTAAAGDVLDNKGKVTINVDVDKEIVEEVKNKDVALRGIPNIVESRRENHGKRMVADLDRAFFAVAEAAGSEVVLTGITAVEDQLEALIQSIETTNNDYVDGVDRDMIAVTMLPSAYGKVRNYLDTVKVQVGTDVEEFKAFHGVIVLSNTRQTKAALAQAIGSVGQLVLADQYDAERIPLSNDTAIELFYSRGTAAVSPDLIKWAAIG